MRLASRIICLAVISWGVFNPFPGFTGTLIVGWLPNTEPDLAGYKVYYGLESRAFRSYQWVAKVGNVTSYQVTELEDTVRYYFAVTAYDFSGNESDYSEEVSAVVGSSSPVPEVLLLYQNYPNPFNPTTQIKFSLPEKGHVSLVIYNVLGKRVATLVDEEREAENYVEPWNGRDDQGRMVSGGEYFYQVKALNYIQTKKMLFVR